MRLAQLPAQCLQNFFGGHSPLSKSLTRWDLGGWCLSLRYSGQLSAALDERERWIVISLSDISEKKGGNCFEKMVHLLELSRYLCHFSMFNCASIQASVGLCACNAVTSALVLISILE